MIPEMNRHHLFFPRRKYVSALEKTFRNLPCNIVYLPVATHSLLHRCQDPPHKPSVKDMKEAIELHERRGCGCKQ